MFSKTGNLRTIANRQTYGEDAALARLFKEKNIRRTIVTSSLDADKTYIHNDERVTPRFLPASTFKIPNPLIALEEEAIATRSG